MRLEAAALEVLDEAALLVEAIGERQAVARQAAGALPALAEGRTDLVAGLGEE